MTGRAVVLGDVLSDVIVRLGEPITVGSDSRGAIDVRPGGSAGNLTAWLAPEGIEVHCISRVGSDAFGEFLLDDLRRAGVVPHVVLDPHRSTGTIISLVDLGGERSMITDRGAILAFRAEDLPAALFRPGDWFHLSGYMLFEPGIREVALAALDLARDAGMGISVDPASHALLTEAGPKTFVEWTRGADLCFPNLDEGRVLSGETEPERIVQRLSRAYGAVVLKRGVQGALYGASGGPTIGMSAILTELVDSTGCGDAFCAGFLSRRIGGASPEDALAAAVRLGARAAGLIGARPR